MSAAIRPTEPEPVERPRLRSAKALVAEQALRGVTNQLATARAKFDADAARLAEADRLALEALAVGRVENRHAIDTAREALAVSSAAVARLEEARGIASRRLDEIRATGPSDSRLAELDGLMAENEANLRRWLADGEKFLEDSMAVAAQAEAETASIGVNTLRQLLSGTWSKGLREMRLSAKSPSFSGWWFTG